jgi:copper transport protein
MLTIRLLTALLTATGPATPAPMPMLRTLLLHAALESTEPAAGDTVTKYPAVIRLVFSEPIESVFGGLTLTDGTGRAIKLSPRIDPHNINALIADFPELSPGGYLVTWRVVSADGHPVGGYFQFYAAAGPPGKSVAEILSGTPPAPRLPEVDPAGHAAGMTGEPPVASAIIRGAAQIVLIALAGLLVLLNWGIPTRTGRIARLELILSIAAPVLLAADFFLWLQHAAPDGAVTLDTISEAIKTQNGAGYGLRVLLAVITLWALALARSPGVAATAAFLAVVITGATGHPAAIRPTIAIPAKIVHLAAASLWTGGLLVLLLGTHEGEDYQRDAWRVSRAALLAVIAIALTGAVETLLFLPSLRDLFRSTYGWLVIGKLAGLGVLIAYGARNRFSLLPRLQNDPASQPLRRSVAWETGWMTAVVVLAAFLAYIPPPTPPGVNQMSMPGMPGHDMSKMNPSPEADQ